MFRIFWAFFMSWFIILGWFPRSKDILNHSLLNRFNQLKLDIYFCKPRWICKNNLGLNRSSIFNRTDLIHDCHSPTQPQLNLTQVGSDKGIGRNQPPTNLILRCKLYSIPGFMRWYNWYMFNCCFCCHSPTQPQHELELELIMGRNPPTPGTFKALPGHLGNDFQSATLF
jgi:hypothetical protein